MARAGHRPVDTPALLLPMPRPLAWMAATAALALAAACLHDDAVAPSAQSAQAVMRQWNGTAWTSVAIGTLRPLHPVWGSAATNVIAVGDDGQMTRFDGQMWRSVWSGTSSHLLGVFAVPGTGGYVAVGTGGVILRSVELSR